MQTVILLVFCSIALSSANNCPNVEPVDNFDIERLMGPWYQLMRYENGLEEHEHCPKLNFGRDGNGYTFRGSSIRDNNKPLVVEGVLTPVKNASGILYFTSSSFQDIDNSDKLPTVILDVDYDKYVIFYDCHYDEQSKAHHDFFWIITKLKTYEGETKIKIDNFLKNATFIDKTKLVRTNWKAEC